MSYHRVQTNDLAFFSREFSSPICLHPFFIHASEL